MSVDIFCGGAIDSSITVWDVRINNHNSTSEFGCKISFAHGKYYFITLVSSITYLLFDEYLKLILFCHIIT